ncbi:hypothetical protein BC829DRAFT_52443 [Chytridium lagenaria]|nr:hypothetical protein BC829DRAFT_52443 [Chytridium lagenaria]
MFTEMLFEVFVRILRFCKQTCVTFCMPRVSMADLQVNFASVFQRMNAACERAAVTTYKPRLVAVSKTKPVADVKAAYDLGQRHFGENYVQELVDKAPVLPADIKWHFIGTLQSNKCKLLAAIPNLFAIETLDNIKKAGILQKLYAEKEGPPLNVFIQVNTSGEDSKSGLSAAECVSLVDYILSDCPNLKVMGLMTIGAADREEFPNPDFWHWCNLKKKIDAAKGLNLELSMGMSDDFEHAIELGSTNVRVGSSLFGARERKA